MNASLEGHICIVFALEHYNPLGMIRGLGENGINPVYISVKRRGESAAKSRYISELHRVDSVEEGYALLLEKYSRYDYAHRPILFFSDDRSAGYFDEHYDEIKDRFILFNGGRSGRINEYMDKYRLQELAVRHGFKALPSWVADRGEIPEGLVYPLITKDISPNSGSWKSDVFICRSESELKSAYEHITSPKVLLQRFADKKNELALQGYSINGGKDIHIITAMNWKYLIEGYYSPYHDVYMPDDPETERKIRAMLEEIGYEGVFETEFLIDGDGTRYFLEINFRASAWNHTTNYAGMAESYLWAKGMLRGGIDPADRKSFEPFTSMSEIIDYGKRVDSGKVPLPQWLADFKNAKCTYYYNKDDMAPWEYVSDKWEQYK